MIRRSLTLLIFLALLITAQAQNWQPVQYANGTSPLARHENGFVEVNGKFYLLGGRAIKNVNIFDPVTRVWTAGAAPPIELHHFQPVVYQNRIYAICAMTGIYPDETPLDRIYIYDPALNTWTQGATIPVARRRGSAGLVLFNNKFYIVSGIQVGHRSGWVPWTDEYDPTTGIWTVLPDAPQARDHFHAGLINGKIYCAGGRRTSQPNFAANTIANVDVFDIASRTWSTPTQLPTPSGAPAVAVVNNELVVAGGEVDYQTNALSTVQSYNPVTNAWTIRPNLNVGRHGTQFIYYSGTLYIAAGSTTQGGGGENNTMASAPFGSPPANTPPVVIQTPAAQSVPSTQATVVLQLGQIFNDDGGVNNLTFTVPNNTNAALLSNTQIVGTQMTFTLSGTTGSGTITLRATDASNAFVQTTFQLTVTPGGTSTLTNVIRINSGGPAQNFAGEAWVADQYFTGGSVYSTTSPISNSTQDQIYQTERFGNFSYAIPVGQAGTYAVDLHLAEIYFAATGQRRFNINIENGQFVRNNFDIIQTYGANNAAFVLRADNLNITDGTINITFTNVVDNAKVSGIAVGRYSSAPPANTPPTIVQAYPNQSVPSTQTSLVVQLNQIFNDDGGVNNLTFSVPNNTNGALITNTQIVGTQLTFTLSGTTGSGNITLRATDASNAFVEDVFQLTVTPPAPLQLTNIIRINSAGPSQNYAGEIWVADQYATGGAGLSQGVDITNTTKDEIYQSERHGNISYAIPVPGAGTYAVDLHFAENFWNAAGARLFNINVENGQFVRNNFDLFQTAGGKNLAYVLRADNLSITDGIINITLTAVIDEATIAGVVVGRYEPTPTNTPPLVLKPAEDKILLSTQGSFVVQLTEVFTDDGGVNNLSYSVPGNTNAGLISNTQLVGSQLTFTLSGLTGDGNITLRATDASNTFVEDVFHLTVTPGTNQPIAVIARINAGGGAQNFNGENWVADQNFSGGSVYSTTSAINNTTQDQIYQSERYGNFSYVIGVPHAGIYGVDLHFAEIYFTNAGSRVFNINIENGQFVRNNLDLIQTYGPNNTANVLHVENLNITDGAINITFTSVVDNAKVSGIVVNEYANTNPNTPPVVVQAPAAQSVPSNQATVVLQLGQIFNDDGGVNNLTFTVPSNTNAALLSNTQIAGTQLTFTLSGTTGSGTITLRATDASNAFVQTTFALTVTPAGTPTLTNVIRINSGGPAQNFGGEAWVADQYFTGGTPYSTASAISNTTQDQIYQTERYGNFSYAIPVGQAGTYAVDLHFAEIYFSQVGQRRFNINIENGQFVRNNFDIIQTYGTNNAAYVLRADNLNITDGTINITFTTVLDNAKVSGIAVGRYSSGSGARMATESGYEPIVEKPKDVIIPERQASTYQVYPNPTQNDEFYVKIEVEQRERWNFTLMDFAGRQITLGSFELDQGVQELTFDIRPYNLSAGIYYLAIQNGQAKKNIKLAIK